MREGGNPLASVQWWLWLAIGVVALTYMLAALVKLIFPLLIVGAALAVVYRLIFKRHW